MKKYIPSLRVFFSLLLFAVMVVTLPAKASAQQVSGAIFTTDVACNGTDLNIYALRTDVYLDGGPAQSGAAGLPDGEYYVQVTEPEGALLGTSLGTGDETPVLVVNGEFVICYQLWNILEKASDGSQGYDLTSNSGGEYKVWVSNDSTFNNADTKTDNFKVEEVAPNPSPSATPEPSVSPNPSVSPTPVPTPSPSPSPELRVEKFYDANANGVMDATEQLITGWRVSVTNGINWIGYTLVHLFLTPDTYTVSEFMPVETNWYATTPNPVVVTLDIGDDELVQFGNVCTGAGGGHTRGYWSNKNGQATMNDGGTMGPELAMLSALNLRTYTGAPFDPATYPQFKTWLTSANATNMSYMLSAQLAAMKLNVESGMVNGSALIYAPELMGYPVPGLTTLGYISVNHLMTAANTELGTHEAAWAADPWRAYQGALKDVLDRGNNNTGFVQATPCPFTFAPLE